MATKNSGKSSKSKGSKLRGAFTELQDVIKGLEGVEVSPSGMEPFVKAASGIFKTKGLIMQVLQEEMGEKGDGSWLDVDGLTEEFSSKVKEIRSLPSNDLIASVHALTKSLKILTEVHFRTVGRIGSTSLGANRMAELLGFAQVACTDCGECEEGECEEGESGHMSPEEINSLWDEGGGDS